MSETQHKPETGPAEPAVRFDPDKCGDFSREDYRHAAAAWGDAINVGHVLVRQHELLDGVRVVFNMKHENGGYGRPPRCLARRPPRLDDGHLRESASRWAICPS